MLTFLSPGFDCGHSENLKTDIPVQMTNIMVSSVYPQECWSEGKSKAAIDGFMIIPFPFPFNQRSKVYQLRKQPIQTSQHFPRPTQIACLFAEPETCERRPHQPINHLKGCLNYVVGQQTYSVDGLFVGQKSKCLLAEPATQNKRKENMKRPAQSGNALCKFKSLKRLADINFPAGRGLRRFRRCRQASKAA